MGNGRFLYDRICACYNCDGIAVYDDDEEAYICKKCGTYIDTDRLLMSDEDREYYDLYGMRKSEYLDYQKYVLDSGEYDEFDIPECCIACGGPWPDCETSCKLFDD